MHLQSHWWIFKLQLQQDNFSQSFCPICFQFALSPSDFSSGDVPEEELEEVVSRGVRIMYNFPWGQEPLETLWIRGDTELLQAHKGARSKLQVSLLLLSLFKVFCVWSLSVPGSSLFFGAVKTVTAEKCRNWNTANAFASWRFPNFKQG